MTDMLIRKRVADAIFSDTELSAEQADALAVKLLRLMRSPTEAMTEAGEAADILQWSLEPGEGLDGIDIKPAWAAMIDVAIGETKG